MSDYDLRYWGPAGIDISRWRGTCGRGAPYKDQGVEIPGTQASHKISTGRKARGMASEGLARQEKLKEAS